MGIGSSWAVQRDEDNYRERIAQEIATRAARWVAAGDKGRSEAIAAAADELRQESEAQNDITGTLEAELSDNPASKNSPSAQVEKIKAVLIDAARKEAAKF